MNRTTERTLATVLGVLPALVIPVSTALADNTPMGGGMMGNGSTYGHRYGFNNAWWIADSGGDMMQRRTATSVVIPRDCNGSALRNCPARDVSY